MAFLLKFDWGYWGFFGPKTDRELEKGNYAQISVFIVYVSAHLLFTLSMLKDPHIWFSAEIERFKTGYGEGCHSGLRQLLERVNE